MPRLSPESRLRTIPARPRSPLGRARHGTIGISLPLDWPAPPRSQEVAHREADRVKGEKRGEREKAYLLQGHDHGRLDAGCWMLDAGRLRGARRRPNRRSWACARGRRARPVLPPREHGEVHPPGRRHIRAPRGASDHAHRRPGHPRPCVTFVTVTANGSSRTSHSAGAARGQRRRPLISTGPHGGSMPCSLRS
jgi:hypothetical protein